jgi:O-antigen/teichoic acid export membrane protein
MENYDHGFRAILRKLAKGMSIYTMGTAANKLLLLGIQILLARQLRIAGYGLYNIGFSAIILLQSVALLGLDQAVLRYAAVYRGRGQLESVKGTLLASLVFGVIAGAAVAGALMYLAPAVSVQMFNDPSVTSTLQIFAVALPFCIVARITGAFAQAHHDILRMTVIQQISQPAVNIVLLGAVILAGGGLRGAVCAFAASSAFSAIAGLYCIRTLFPELYSSMPMRVNYGELFRYSIALSAIAIAYQLFWRAPSLLLGHFASAREVGLYSAAVTLASPPGFISLIFAQPFMPMMVDLHEQGNLSELDALYRTVTRWTSMVVIPGFGFLVLFRHRILTLFGRDFQGAGDILILMGLAWMVYYAKGPVAALLDMTGWQYIDLANLAGVLVLSAGLGLWWIPRAGAIGAGWAVAIAIVAWSVAEAIEAWVIFRIPPLSRSLVQTAILAAIVFGFGFLLQERVSTLTQALIVGTLYLFLSYLFGFTPDDRNLVCRGICKVTALLARPAIVPGQD